MHETFAKLYRHAGLVTAFSLAANLGFFLLAVLAALLGLRDAVRSLNQATVAMVYVSGAFLAAFLLVSLVAAVVRWLDRRRTPTA